MTTYTLGGAALSSGEFVQLRTAMYTWAELLEVHDMYFTASAHTVDFTVTVKYGMPPRFALDVMSGIAPSLVERFDTTDFDKLMLVPYSEVEKAIPASAVILQAAFRDRVAYQCLHEISRQFAVAPVVRPLPDTRPVQDIRVRVPYPMPAPLAPSHVQRVLE